ncbi:ABC transporter permease subunit [Acetivibrio clariflavus]|uniref:ABC transporter permease subunit n=1 Tax=Acetivibrio clariflavus TaxID=288965 RepID=UPI00048485F7|nr:ABC transporter permease subunit [Acetivibrio clariflavus]
MSVFRLELKNTWKSTLKWIIALCSIAFMFLAFFPSMQTESMKELAGAKMEGIDPALLEVLGLSELMDFTVITNYFGYVLQYITLAIMVFAAQMAVNSLVKEETDGTIEFLYSKPISRNAIFIQKVLANTLLFLLLLVALSIITVVGYLSFSEYNFTESIKEVGILYSSMFYIGLIFLSLGTLLSSLLRSSKSSSGIAIAIVFGTFILGIMSVIVKELSFLSYFSPMVWIKTQKLMTEGIYREEWLIGVLTIIICFLASYKIYKKRDMHL